MLKKLALTLALIVLSSVFMVAHTATDTESLVKYLKGVSDKKADDDSAGTNSINRHLQQEGAN